MLALGASGHDLSFALTPIHAAVEPMTQKAIAAEPCEFTFDPESTALLLIDM
jgi:hypothetical protein